MSYVELLFKVATLISISALALAVSFISKTLDVQLQIMENLQRREIAKLRETIKDLREGNKR